MNVDCLRKASAYNPTTLYRIRWLPHDAVTKRLEPYQADLRLPNSFLVQPLSPQSPAFPATSTELQDEVIVQIGLSPSLLEPDCTAVLFTDASELLHLPSVLPGNLQACPVQFVATNAAYELGILLLKEYAEEAGRVGTEGLVERVKACVRRCAYGEHVQFGDSRTVAWPTPSGYSTGGALWCFGRVGASVPFLVHLGRSCGDTNRHPRALDVDSLTRAGLLAFADLTSPLPLSTMKDFLTLVGSIVKRGGNALVPCHAFSALALELIEATFQYLKQTKRFNVTIVIASPQFNTASTKLKRYVDWLSNRMHEQVVAGMECFNFHNTRPSDSNAQSKRVNVVVTQSLSDSSNGSSDDKTIQEPLKPPLVVFAGHPDLSIGEGNRLVAFWATQHGCAQTATSNEENRLQPESHVVLVDATVDQRVVQAYLDQLRKSQQDRDAFTVHKCFLHCHITREEFRALKKAHPCVDLAEDSLDELKGKCVIYVRSWPSRMIDYAVKQCPEVCTARVVSSRSVLLFVHTEGSVQTKSSSKICKLTFDLGENGTIRLLCDDNELRTKFLQLIDGK